MSTNGSVTKKKRQSERLRVRKCGLKDLWLTRQGKWTEDYSKAAVFFSDSAVEKFLEKHGIEDAIGTF